MSQNEFRKYAVGHLGMSGNTMDDYMRQTNARLEARKAACSISLPSDALHH